MRNATATVLFTLCWIATGNSAQGVSGDIAGHIKRLAATEPKAVRLVAVRKLQDAAKNGALHAMPSLLGYLKDQDAEIRSAVLQAVGVIAFDNDLPCPVELIQAFFDPSDDVRHHACTYAGAAWKRYPKDALPLLFKAMEHKDSWVRGCAPMLLAEVGGKDMKVLASLRKALGDKEWGVKGNANAALWKLTEDLTLTVPCWLEALSHLDPTFVDQEKLDPENTRRNLVGLVSALKLKELSEEQPEKLVPVLIKNLSHKSSDIRAIAARILGATSLNPKGKNALMSHKVEVKLHPLLKDPSERVQAEAETALRRIATGDESAGPRQAVSLVVPQKNLLALEPILVTVAVNGDLPELPALPGDKAALRFEVKPAVKPRAGAKPLPFEAPRKKAYTRLYDLLECYQFPAEGTFTVQAVVTAKDGERRSTPVSFTIRRPDKKDPEWGPVDRLHHMPWSNYITDAFCGDTFDVVKRWPDSKLAKYCHYWNGLHYQHKKEYEKAIESFGKVGQYRDFPLREHAEEGVIECLVAQGKPAEAARLARDLRKVLEAQRELRRKQ